MMTEDEAKTKWCPFFQTAAAGAGGSQYSSTEIRTFGNRDKKANPSCLGSACMAWRWREWVLRDYPDTLASKDEPGAVRTGYCGLAGRPHA